MKRFFIGLAILTFGLFLGTTASAGLFIYNDGLAPRDDLGKLHQSPVVLPTDFEPRYSVRFHYYFKGAGTLQNDPAYVAAAQTILRRLGYYCGEIDGVFGPETSDAIMRLQKNYTMRVTGNLNLAVRRALHLP
ncbi:MAG TPA: peptidoglycan-binding domain-containing protein [Chthoniobacterales bacterium]|nr:peptidoglycan-binding domain-containing protein [Chthoniobacterales bacterium]